MDLRNAVGRKPSIFHNFSAVEFVNKLPIKNSIHPVILAGGAGKRLWPVSRNQNPKPFAVKIDDVALFEATASRVSLERGFGPLIILGAHQNGVTIRKGLARVGVTADVVLEPAKRDTGPAVIAAAFLCARKDPQAVVFCLASDHHIRDENAFYECVEKAAAAAQQGFITVIGITPDGPETRFGYLAPGRQHNDLSETYDLKGFFEKPDAETATRYVENGYLWNSGNFIFRADVLLAEAERLAPEIVAAVAKSIEQTDTDANPCTLEEVSYSQAPQISFDYAIMEKTGLGAVVPGDFGWSDVGTWRSVHQSQTAGENNNVVAGDVVTSNVNNSFVQSQGGRLIAVSNLDDIVIIDEPDALLVCPADDGQSVKSLFDILESMDRSEIDRCAYEERPWGTFCTVFKGPGFQVKYITVKPGGKLSLQKHAHRSEHWVVVEGIATVTVNERRQQMQTGEHAHIPLGAVHRLENETEAKAAIMEVQLGEILSEDDIVRIEDIYD